MSISLVRDGTAHAMVYYSLLCWRCCFPVKSWIWMISKAWSHHRAKVISAIFLKDTLDAAQNDAEQLVADRLRKKAQYVRKLEEVRNVICWLLYVFIVTQLLQSLGWCAPWMHECLPMLSLVCVCWTRAFETTLAGFQSPEPGLRWHVDWRTFSHGACQSKGCGILSDTGRRTLAKPVLFVKILDWRQNVSWKQQH